MRIKLKHICKELGGELSGDGEIEISGVSGIKEALPTQITFVANSKYLASMETTEAAAIIIGRDVVGNGKPTVRVENPYWAFVQVLEMFARDKIHQALPGVDDTAIIGKNVKLGERVSIQAFAVIADNVEIGNDTVVQPFVYIGERTKIGADGLIYPHVNIREEVTIGDRVIIHCGAVIGSDGFGFAPVGTRREKSTPLHHKIPQIGTVIIEDDVEIGANTTIDRATLSATHIKRGTKLDNLVQIAHNVVIGEDCCIAAQAGIAGSTIIGDRVNIAGHSGAAGHLTLGDDSVVYAKSAVTKDMPPGSHLSGFPARPHKQELRIHAATRKLPELLPEFNRLQKRVEALEAKIRELAEKEEL